MKTCRALEAETERARTHVTSFHPSSKKLSPRSDPCPPLSNSHTDHSRSLNHVEEDALTGDNAQAISTTQHNAIQLTIDLYGNSPPQTLF